jgi:hypothetical protein
VVVVFVVVAAEVPISDTGYMVGIESCGMRK